MVKNILLLTGSPRRGGNSDMMANAFIKGAQEAGHKIMRFDAGYENILGCKACDSCFSKGSEKACVFNDGFNELAAMMQKAEMIVLVSPLYWFSFSVQIKAAIDKWYSFDVGKKDIPIKEIALLATGETNDIKDYGGMIQMYERLIFYKGWTDKGRILAMNVYEKGDILKTDYLDQAEKLGKSL